MADNYLEKKMEELEKMRKLRSKKTRRVSTTTASLSLDSLFRKNRSHRGYDNNCKITLLQLEQIIGINSLIASTKNQQVLRFKPIIGEQAATVSQSIRLGGLLPELNLPQKGYEPNSYIIVCTKKEHSTDNKWLYIDLGISIQSMLLKAVNMGLNGICIGAYNKAVIDSMLPDAYTSLMLVAIGKGCEKIEIEFIEEGESLNYHREDGVHYVPKIKDLIVK